MTDARSNARIQGHDPAADRALDHDVAVAAERRAHLMRKASLDEQRTMLMHKALAESDASPWTPTPLNVLSDVVERNVHVEAFAFEPCTTSQSVASNTTKKESLFAREIRLKAAAGVQPSDALPNVSSFRVT